MRLPKSLQGLFLLSSLTEVGCLHRAEHLLAEHQPKEALEVLDKRVLQNHELEACLLEAEASLQISDAVRAKDAASRALSIDLSSTKALLARAEAEILLGDALAAAPFLEAALAQGATVEKRLIGRLLRVAPKSAIKALDAGDPESAVRILNLVAKLAPDIAPETLRAQALLARASDKERDGQEEDALTNYKSAAPNLPNRDSSRAWLAVGTISLRQKQLSEADKAFAKSIEQGEAAGDDVVFLTLQIAKRYSDWGEPGRAANLYLALAKKGSSSSYYRQAAELFLAANQPVEADEAFTAYLNTSPDKGSAAREVAAFYQKKGDLASWERYARIAVEAYPRRFLERRALCDVWAEQGRYDKIHPEMEAYLEATRQAAGDMVRAYLEVAQWYGAKNQDEDAVAAYEAARKAGGSPRLELADAYGRLRRIPEMRSALDAYIAASADKRGARIAAAKRLANVGETSAALALFKEVFNQDPSQRDAAYQLADLLYSEGDAAAEERILSAYAAAAKDSALAWRDVGQRYLKRGDKARAERAFISAAGKGSRDASFDLGQLYLSIGDKAKAREAFKRYADAHYDRTTALKDILSRYPANDYEERAAILNEMILTRPNNAEPYLTLGTESLAFGDKKAAMKAFEGYVSASSDKALAYKIIGLRYASAGCPDLAEEAYERAFAEYPETGAGLLARGELALDLGRGALAAEYLERYRSDATPKLPRNLTGIADNLKKQGRCAAAIPFYEDSLALDASQRGAYFYLAECALATGDLNKASMAFEKYGSDSSALLEIGKKYRQFGYDALAIKPLRGALRYASNRPEAFRELTSALTELNQPEVAEEISKELLELVRDDSERYDLHINFARLYKSLSLPKPRLYHLEQADRARPGNGATLYPLIAETLLDLGDFERAFEYYRRGARLSVDPAQALFSNAEALRRAGELGLARELYLASSEAGGKLKLDAKLGAASALYLLGEQEKAVKELLDAAKEEDTPTAWEKASKALENVEEVQLSADALEEALRTNPSPGRDYLELARLRFSLGSPSEARRLLEAFLGATPSTRDLIDAAQVYAKAGAIDEALTSYHSAIRGPEAADALRAFREASQLLLRANNQAALLSLCQELTLSRAVDQGTALLESGKALSQAGLDLEAADMLRAVYSANSQTRLVTEATEELAKLGLLEEAKANYLQLARDSNDPVGVLQRAAERSTAELALPLLDEALRLAPNRAALFELKGKLLADQGELSEAAGALWQATDLSSNPGETAKVAANKLCAKEACASASPFIERIENPTDRLLAKATAEIDEEPPSALLEYLQKRPPKLGPKEAAKLAFESGKLDAAQLALQNAPPSIDSDELLLRLNLEVTQEQYSLPEVVSDALVGASFDKREDLLRLLLWRGEAELALPYVRSLHQERPWEQTALRLFLLSLAGAAPSGWEQDALSAARAYSSSRPQEPSKALVYAAQILSNAGAFHPAETLYEEALRLSPNNTEALLALGKARLAQGDNSGAKEAFSQAIEASPNESKTWAQIGDIYKAAAMPEAVSAYQEALAHSSSPRTWFNLAEAKVYQGDNQGAAAALLQAASLSAKPSAALGLMSLELLSRAGPDAIEAVPLSTAPASPEVKAAKIAQKILSGETEQASALEGLSSELLGELQDISLRFAPSAPFTQDLLPPKEELISVTQELRATPKIDLMNALFTKLKVSPPQTELYFAWVDAACDLSDLDRCSVSLTNTMTSSLLAASLGAAAKQNGPSAKRLAKMGLHLSPSVGAKAYQTLILASLQAGDKAGGAALAEEWRKSAVASGSMLGQALLAVALTQTNIDPIALRKAMLCNDPSISYLARNPINPAINP